MTSVSDVSPAWFPELSDLSQELNRPNRTWDLEKRGYMHLPNLLSEVEDKYFQPSILYTRVLPAVEKIEILFFRYSLASSVFWDPVANCQRTVLIIKPDVFQKQLPLSAFKRGASSIEATQDNLKTDAMRNWIYALIIAPRIPRAVVVQPHVPEKDAESENIVSGG